MRFLCALLLFTSVSALAAEPDYPLAEARECRPRTGLPNFLAKASKPGASIKVAYLGGSITAQNGWRVKSLAHFRQAYPGAKFEEINAAIGGTGSDLGVFRLQQDVLSKAPDLLFVEFAVNDGGAAPESIIRCMEGIVRQTWKAYPNCDICFVYTLVEGMAPTIAAGKFPRSASAMEKVADHYGIPSIHFGLEVAKLAKAGKVLWRSPLPKTEEQKREAGDKLVFAPDSVHPHESTGHQMYLEAIVRSLPPIAQASMRPEAHVLGAPLDAQNFERARLVPVSELKLSEGLAPADMKTDAFAKGWSNRLPAMVKLTKPGQSIEFKFKGTYAAVYDIVGPAGGKVAVTLDDKPSRSVQRIDAYCTYPRLSTFLLGVGLPDAVHTVRLELLADPIDKAAVLAKNKNTIDKPERFAPLHFYPGAVLVVGEIVP